MKNLFTITAELKVETPIEDYWLHVVTREAVPQEGGRIARLWIVDLKV